jgi:hypothetical protein
VVLAAAVFRPYRGNLPLAEDAASDLEYLCEQWARHLWIDTPAPGMVVTTERRSVKRVGQEARRFFNDMRGGLPSRFPRYGLAFRQAL